MLKVTVPAIELYDEVNNQFIELSSQELTLEHSLVSISKWESKWHKAFLDERRLKTREEMLDYVRCMTLTQNVNPEIYNYLPNSVLDKIGEYIEDPMTATTFPDDKTHPTKKKVTNEEIYSWMVQLQIPFECQKWHINRLLTLIKACNALNTQQKMPTSEIYKQNKALNAARKAARRTRG